MTDNRTTELREKLTERGIEYTANDHMGACETSWNGFTAMQLTPGAKLMMVFTPEQAIAATLGNSRAERTCKPIIEPWESDKTKYDAYCGNCNYPLGDGKLMLWNYCPNCGARREDNDN